MGQQTLVGQQVVTRGLDELLQELGFTIYAPESDAWPQIVGVHPDQGILAVDIVHGDSDAPVALNRKIATLREAVPEIARVNVARRVVDLDASDSTSKVLTHADALQGTWLRELPERPIASTVGTALASFFAPRITVDLPQRHSLTDEHAQERAAHRVTLDAAQSAAAQREIDDVLVITGPPGSGKTLVLAARARWLAREHPDWRIQLLCFNRLLVPYLRSLVAGCPNVWVSTFGKFSFGFGYRVSLEDEDRATREVAWQLPRVKPVLDALLIDEWQDFIPAWTELAMAMVRPGRGGIALAGDPLQALYRDSEMTSELINREVTTVSLTRPYRSTQQVLQVTSALDPSMEVTLREQAPQGEPVDLVWAESAKEQAAAVARDVQLLLDAGDRRRQDIGVLVTRKWLVGQIFGRLKDAGIDCEVAYPKNAEQLSLSTPAVKIMTVHSAKGYEFDVVFLVGLESLPDPDGTPDSERQGRAGYVGATRARDQLVLTYSKDNTYLERIRSLSDDTLRRWVWPDDYPEA